MNKKAIVVLLIVGVIAYIFWPAATTALTACDCTDELRAAAEDGSTLVADCDAAEDAAEDGTWVCDESSDKSNKECGKDCQKACCLGCKATVGEKTCIFLEDGSMPCCIEPMEE